MANPNILESSTVLGNNALVAVTTNATSIVNNAVSSGKLYKVNSLIASNVDGSTDQDLTVNIYSQDDLGGTAYAIVSTVIVPADASIVVLDKTSAFYLKEDQSIGAIAGGNSDIVITASWEEISITGSGGGGTSTSAVENKLINGAFAVAQRGTSFTSGSNNDDAYTLDRWYILSDGNDAIDVTQNTADTDTDDKYCIALDVETINKKFGIAQIIENENCYDLQDKTVTLSFKAKVSSTSKLDNVKCAIVAWSGTADSVTSDIISAWEVEGTNPTLIANATYENTPANLGVTTSWATYNASATIDTAGTNNVIVFIWSDVTDTTAGDFLYITNVQLEVGSSVNTFQRRLYGEELALCQRYYYKIGEGGSAYTQFGVGRAFSSTAGNGPVHFPVPMRSAPTFAFSGVVGDYDFSPTAIAGGAVPGNNIHMTVEMSFTSITSGSIFMIGANAGAAGPAAFAFNSEL